MAERRRIERELHDGVQQHLVAVIVNLQLARELADADLDGAKAVLDELSADARDALESVRELAQRALPVGPARPRAGRGRPGRRGRSPARGCASRRLRPRRGEDADAAVYDCCVELIANVAEHAGAGARATVRLWQEDGAVRFEVATTGWASTPARRGVTAASRASPTPWARSEARSRSSREPGRGTRVAGSVPVAS